MTGISREPGRVYQQWLLSRVGSAPEKLRRNTGVRAYQPELDGIRFVAMLVVLVWHASLRATRSIEQLEPAKSSWYGWFPHGEVGVALFFVLSGYILAEGSLHDSGKRFSVGVFLARRFRRIYPPYLIVLLGCFALVSVSGYANPDIETPPAAALAAGALYLNGIVFDSPSSLNPPMWSLEVEAQFYIIVPFLFLALLSLRSRLVRIGLTATIFLTFAMILSLLRFEQATDLRFRLGLFSHAYLFVGGILLSLSLPRGKSSENRIVGLLLDGAGLLGLLLSYVAGVRLTSEDARSFGGLPLSQDAILLFTAVTLVFLGARHGRMFRKVLSGRWVSLIGSMCFSIYLVHVPVLQVLDTILLSRFEFSSIALTYSVYLTLGVSLSIAAGAGFFVLIERRFVGADQRGKSVRKTTPPEMQPGGTP